MPYSEDIEKIAKESGYKTSNLLHLKQNLEGKETSESQIKVRVPDFFGISHNQVLNFLNTNSPDWRNIFHRFIAIRKRNQSPKTLSEAEKKVLAELRNSILNSFTNNQFDKNLLGELFSSMDDEELVMVRSSGREDSTELSNPGGNDSFPSKVKDIGKTIGKVVASYFGERSLQQRLDARDDIAKEPFCPVLVQSMIRETENHKVASGVIYAEKDGSTRIDSAFGHGDLITSSKGAADNYYVSRNGVTYGDIKTKNSRIVSSWNEESQSMELVFAQNNQDKNQPSLDEEAVFRLHETAQEICKLYQRQMDIEFVYDASEKTIFLVQARAIVEGKRVNLMPSSINPEFINGLKANNKIGSGQVITPETKTAIIINDPNEIIICQTISEALAKYQRSAIKPKAVIVQKEAASNSHEALEFNKNAVPVLQLNNFKEVETYLGKEAIIIDPQHKSVFHVSKDLASKPDLIQEGIFSSTLSSQVTPNKALNWALQEPSEEEKKSRRGVSINGKELGNLLQEAKKGNNEATLNLLSFLHKIAFSDEFFPNNEEENNKKTLPQALEILSTPNYSGDNKSQKEALASSLRDIAHQYKNKKISRELFQQIFISGGEIFLMLDEVEKASEGLKDSYEEQKEGVKEEFQEEVKEDSDHKAIDPLTYLNSLEKFTGLFKSLPKKGALSESLVTQLQEKKHKDEITKSNPNLSGESLQYYLETTKLSKFLIKEEHRQNWIEFCAEICADEAKAKVLGTIVGVMVENNIHQDWINIIFTDALEKAKGNNNKILSELIKSLPSKEKFKQFNIVTAELEKMNSQISAWGEPQNFDKLYASLKDSLAIINQNLQYNKEDSAVERIITRQKAFELIDAMDGTIKKVMKSNSYKSGEDQNPEEYQQQCEHSKALVGEFFEIMKSWSEHTNFEHQDFVIRMMRGAWDREFNPPFKKNLLNISQECFVSSATIDTSSIMYKSEKDFTPSLEDYFTTVHQSFNAIVSNLTKEDISYAKYKDFSPELIKYICNKLEPEHKFMHLTTDYPINSLRYNKELRAHSAIIDIKYDINNTKEAKIICDFYGDNEYHRWDSCSSITSYFANLGDCDLKFTKNPCSSDKGFSFEVIVNNEKQVENLVKTLDILYRFSFCIREHYHHLTSSSNKEQLQEILLIEVNKHQIQRNKESIKKILEAGIDLNEFGEGLTASSILVQKTDSYILKELVDKLPESALKAENQDGTTVFSHIKDSQGFKILFEKGLRPTEVDKENLQKILLIEVNKSEYQRNTEAIKAMLEAGIDLNEFGEGLTASSILVQKTNSYDLKELVDQLPQSALEAQNRDGTTVFSQVKDCQSFKILFEKGLRPIEADNEELLQILTSEISSGNYITDELRFLIQNYPESLKNHNDKIANSFASIAAKKNNLDLLILFAENGFDFVSCNNEGLTPFTAILKNLHSYQLQNLVEDGLKNSKDGNRNIINLITAQNNDGTTACSYVKSTEDLKMLLKVIKPTENDLEKFPEIAKNFIEKGKYFEFVEMAKLGFVNIKTKCGDETIGDLLREGKGAFLLEPLQDIYNDKLPEIIERRINTLSSAIINSALTRENFSPNAQRKLEEYHTKIMESLMEKYGSNIDRMREDFQLVNLSDIDHPLSINRNQKVQSLGESFLEQIGAKESKKFNISCAAVELKTVATIVGDEFKFSLDEANLTSNEEQKEEESKIRETEPSSEMMAAGYNKVIGIPKQLGS